MDDTSPEIAAMVRCLVLSLYISNNIDEID